MYFFFYTDLGLIVLGALGERICNQFFVFWLKNMQLMS